MLGGMGLWAGKDLYHATPTVTRGLGFPVTSERTPSFSRLLQKTRGCRGSILTQILTGPLFRRKRKKKNPTPWSFYLLIFEYLLKNKICRLIEQQFWKWNLLKFYNSCRVVASFLQHYWFSCCFVYKKKVLEFLNNKICWLNQPQSWKYSL
jgi:hypothetical protein